MTYKDEARFGYRQGINSKVAPLLYHRGQENGQQFKLLST
jgi:hypothetical protein